jgi:hypothetical protein
MMPDQARNWPRQQSTFFYAAGFDALVKRWHKCINVGGGYVGEINVFSRFEYHMFYVLYPFVGHLLTLPRTFIFLKITPMDLQLRIRSPKISEI